MSSVLLCAAPFQGHVMPMLPMARRLVEQGHRVRMLTGKRYEDAVTSSGARWEPLPAQVDLDETDIDGLFPARRKLRGLAQGKFDLEHVFLRTIPAQAARIEELLDDEPADTLVVETMFFGAIPVALRSRSLGSRSRRPRVVAWGCNPLSLPGAGLAPPGTGWAPASGRLGRLRNRAAEFGLRKVLFPSLQEIARASVREAGADLPVFFFDWVTLVDDVVQLTVPGFEYPRPGSHPRVHFVGPLSISDVGTHPLPEWWDRLDHSRPTVLVTQGSAEPDLSQLIRPALAALGGRKVNVVVSLGGRTAEPDLDLPENAYYAPALPYDAVFPSLAAFVTNGGYGGLGFAIRHGVPVVTVGRSQDKAEVAARVRWSGIGIGLQKQKASPRTIARAVDKVLHETRYRTRARNLRDEAARAPGLDGAIRVIVDS